MISPIEILPSSVRLRVFTWGSVLDRITLSSSNSLRRHMRLSPEQWLPGPVPKFVTRKNPSLDNYFADLLLRSCYGPTDYLPPYDEHVLRGSPDELPSSLNAKLVGAVLIGIGGRSKNPDFVKVYDEHSFHGTRTAPSVSQIVFTEHLGAHAERSGVKSVGVLLKEINSIDSEGGASYDHLYNILKSLNSAEFIQPGFVFEPLSPLWKRAVIGACLSSVCVAIEDFQRYDIEQANLDLGKEWDTYLAKIEKRIKYGFPDRIIPAAVNEIKRLLLQNKEPQVNGVPTYLTLKKILFALRHSWQPAVATYLLEFMFEALRQAQQCFEEMRKTELPIRRVNNDYALVYYSQEPKDRMPHRGLLAGMNHKAIKGLLVIYHPLQEITAIFGSRHLPKAIWRRFVETLLETEGDGVWYVPTGADGTYANFVLNGTESYRGVPKTKLGRQELLDLFAASTSSELPAKQTPAETTPQ